MNKRIWGRYIRRSFAVFLTMLLVVTSNLGVFGISGFSDVKGSDWYSEAVQYGVSHNLVAGTSSTTFSPYSLITRGQYITILGRMENVDTAALLSSMGIKTISESDYYLPYLLWALQAEVVIGPSNTFNPTNAITREQMAVFTANYIDYKGAKIPNDPSAKSSFNDASRISSSCKSSVDKLRKCGLMTGDEYGNFNPQSTLTRAECVAVVMRLREKIIDAGVKMPEISQSTSVMASQNTSAGLSSGMSTGLTPSVTGTVAPTTSYASEITALVNKERASVGLAPLSYNSAVAIQAQRKAQDMATNNYFSHTSPSLGSAFDMMSSNGITYRAAGENLAKGHSSPESVVSAWMSSSGHRSNILNANYSSLGVGYVEAVDGTTYWVQFFIG